MIKIICCECNKEITIEGTTGDKIVEKEGFEVFATTQGTVVIECECGNGVWVV